MTEGNEVKVGAYVRLGKGKALWEVLAVWPTGEVSILSNNGRTRLVTLNDVTVYSWGKAPGR